MGYEITCLDSDLRFTRPRAALEALQRQNGQEPLFDDDEVTTAIEDATTIAEALEACGFEVELGSEDEVEKVFYEGKLLGELAELERLFSILAPFVVSGSFLSFHDGEGNAWRYELERGRLRVRDVTPPP